MHTKGLSCLQSRVKTIPIKMENPFFSYLKTSGKGLPFEYEVLTFSLVTKSNNLQPHQPANSCKHSMTDQK